MHSYEKTRPTTKEKLRRNGYRLPLGAALTTVLVTAGFYTGQPAETGLPEPCEITFIGDDSADDADAADIHELRLVVPEESTANRYSTSIDQADIDEYYDGLTNPHERSPSTDLHEFVSPREQADRSVDMGAVALSAECTN